MTSYQGVDSWLDFVSLGGVASLGMSFIFSMLSRLQSGKAKQLDGAFPVERLNELGKLKTLMPVLVAVRGIVASDEPKHCELCDKKAVIHKIVEEEVWRKERESGRTVLEPIEIRKDDGSGRLLIENASSAERLQSAMEMKQVFVPEDVTTSGSFVRLMLGRAWKMTKQGVRKTEHFLPVGTAITAIGEVSQNTLEAAQAAVKKGSMFPGTKASQLALTPEGSGPARLASDSSTVAMTTLGQESNPVSTPYVLRRPSSGPFFITSLTLQQLQASILTAAKTFKYIAIGFGVLGAVLMTKKVIEKLLRLRQAAIIRRRVAEAEVQRKRQRAAAAAAKAAAASSVGDPAADGLCSSADAVEDDDDWSDGKCVVCMEANAELVFTECGHLCSCENCGPRLTRCPVCRTPSRKIKVYRP